MGFRRTNTAYQILSIVALSLCLSVNATTFIPLPIEDQIDATDSVVWATNTGKAYKRLPNGDVVTEYSFQVNAASGLPEHKVVSPNTFKVLTPGGLWQGRYYQVHGVASFKEGEEALIFLKAGDHGWYVNNLAMGKFEVMKDVEGIWFRNSIFPTHPKLGLIPLEKMNNLLVEKFSSPLLPIDADKYVHRESELENVRTPVGQSRKPASIDLGEDTMTSAANERSYGLMWMMIALGVLGFIYRSRAKKDSKKRM